MSTEEGVSHMRDEMEKAMQNCVDTGYPQQVEIVTNVGTFIVVVLKMATED